ncbi:MAG: hypothetical protein R6X22_07755 [Gemmatimonadota bacterium]
MAVDRTRLTTGIVAGVLGATTIALLFFVVDLVRGEPLGTVRFLASVLYGGEEGSVGAVGVALYTAAHYLVFASLGALAASLLDVTGIPPRPLVGAAAGLFFCSLIFYPALALSGSSVLDAPAWPWVFTANFLAGLVIVGWIRRRGTGEPAGGIAPRGFLRPGVITGLIGAATLAAWFLVVDSVSGRPLFTPAALGSVLLSGVDAASAVSVELEPVLAYTLLHVTAFVLLGLLSAALAARIERFPPLAFAFVMLFVVYWTFVVFLTTMLGTWLLRELAWWSVFAGNLVAAAAMGAYLWKAHPRLREGLTHDALWEPDRASS